MLSLVTMRVAYILVALAVLSPGIVISLIVLTIVLRESTFVREQSSPGPLHVYAIGIGKVEVKFYPRRWPATLVIVGALLWIAGIVVLLLVPR